MSFLFSNCHRTGLEWRVEDDNIEYVVVPMDKKEQELEEDDGDKEARRDGGRREEGAI